jgi:hypothetical protein
LIFFFFWNRITITIDPKLGELVGFQTFPERNLQLFSSNANASGRLPLLSMEEILQEAIGYSTELRLFKIYQALVVEEKENEGKHPFWILSSHKDEEKDFFYFPKSVSLIFTKTYEFNEKSNEDLKESIFVKEGKMEVEEENQSLIVPKKKQKEDKKPLICGLKVSLLLHPVQDQYLHVSLEKLSGKFLLKFYPNHAPTLQYCKKKMNEDFLLSLHKFLFFKKPFFNHFSSN